MTRPGEPWPGRVCRVCGLPDPLHDWDTHDAQPAAPEAAGLIGAALPNMLDRSSTRGGQAVRVLALHTTEGIMRAADLRAWAAWKGSSHASADETGALLGPADGFVPYHLAAWTLRSGNPWSENLELCGYASWTRAQWLSRPELLDAAARWLAERGAARGIPLVKLTAQQYRAGASGVIDHNDHTIGYQDGTHWDVGSGFPWDVVLDSARRHAAGHNGGGVLMALTDAQQQQLLGDVAELRKQLVGGPAGKGWPSFRHGDEGRTVLTPVDYLRNVDREVNGRLDLTGRPGPEKDTLLGHVLSTRAEVRAIAATLDALVAQLRSGA